jgi:hypothetical protein
MSGYPSRIGVARFTKEVNQATAVSNISTAITAGTEVPDGFRHEFLHLALVKNCTATIDVHGLANVDGSQKWLCADTVSFDKTINEVALVRGMTAFKRVQVAVNAIGSSGAINAHWGFSE